MALLKAFFHTSVSVVWLPLQIAVHVLSAYMTDRASLFLFPTPSSSFCLLFDWKKAQFTCIFIYFQIGFA